MTVPMFQKYLKDLYTEIAIDLIEGKVNSRKSH